jgi:quinol monooxygenase YgiN
MRRPTDGPAIETWDLVGNGRFVPSKEQHMVIVAGHIVVDPQQRESYLAGCVNVVELARRAPGCLDFAITADLVDADRINVFERWESQAAVEAFRGGGPSDEQTAAVLDAAVAEYDVADLRSLT